MRLKHWSVRALLAAFTVLASVEAFARFGLGLGSPPLSVTHPTIEYMFAPNQDVMRFGNRQLFNEYGMRSAAVPEDKPDGEFRVLAIGDSVLNGGNLEHQQNLATSLLSDGNVRVLNASAGSWGPQNMLAYIEEFGLFASDLLVVVLSEHDARDVPTFSPLDPNTHPTNRPVSALTEGLTRYLPRYLPLRRTGPSGPNSVSGPAVDPRALDAVQSLSNLPISTCFVFHPTRNEFMAGKLGEGHGAIEALADEVKVIDGAAFLRSSADFRDSIHLSTSGQQALANAMAACWK